MELSMSEHHAKFQKTLKAVNQRDAELTKNLWAFFQMRTAVTQTAERIQEDVRIIETIEDA